MYHAINKFWREKKHLLHFLTSFAKRFANKSPGKWRGCWEQSSILLPSANLRRLLPSQTQQEPAEHSHIRWAWGKAIQPMQVHLVMNTGINYFQDNRHLNWHTVSQQVTLRYPNQCLIGGLGCNYVLWQPHTEAVSFSLAQKMIFQYKKNKKERAYFWRATVWWTALRY